MRALAHFALGFVLLIFVTQSQNVVLRFQTPATAAGVAYLVWRKLYFGLPLPLPLYVKALGVHGPSGIEPTIEWMMKEVLSE